MENTVFIKTEHEFEDNQSIIQHVDYQPASIIKLENPEVIEPPEAEKSLNFEQNSSIVPNNDTPIIKTFKVEQEIPESEEEIINFEPQDPQKLQRIRPQKRKKKTKFEQISESTSSINYVCVVNGETLVKKPKTVKTKKKTENVGEKSLEGEGVENVQNLENLKNNQVNDTGYHDCFEIPTTVPINNDEYSKSSDNTQNLASSDSVKTENYHTSNSIDLKSEDLEEFQETNGYTIIFHDDSPNIEATKISLEHLKKSKKDDSSDYTDDCSSDDDDSKEGMFSCEQCNKKFILKSNFDRHECRICNFCNKIFTTSRSLKRHVINTHPVTDEVFECKECNVKFKAKEYLETHIKGHEKSYGCETCGKRFGTKSLVNEHKLKHDNPEIMICNICGLKLASRSSLSYHKRTHDVNRIKHIKCEECSFTTDDNRTLVKHMKSHANREERYKNLTDWIKCEKCSARLKNKQSLTNHMYYVHSGVTYQCNICGAVLKSARVLKRHHQNIHVKRAKLLEESHKVE